MRDLEFNCIILHVTDRNLLQDQDDIPNDRSPKDAIVRKLEPTQKTSGDEDVTESPDFREISVEVQGQCSDFHVGLTAVQRRSLRNPGTGLNEIELGDCIEIFGPQNESLGYFTVGKGKIIKGKAGEPNTHITLAGNGRAPLEVGAQLKIRAVDLTQGLVLSFLKELRSRNTNTIRIPSWAMKLLGLPLREGACNIYRAGEITLSVNGFDIQVQALGGGSELQVTEKLAAQFPELANLKEVRCYFSKGKIVI